MTDFIIQSEPLKPELQKYDAFWRPTDYAILNGATRDNCIRPIITKELAREIKKKAKTFTHCLESRVYYFGRIPQSALGTVATEVADRWYKQSDAEKSTYAGIFDVYPFHGDNFTRTTPLTNCELSDGLKATPGRYYWCRLSLIDWFEDKKTGNLISVSPLMPNTPEAKKQLMKLLQYARKELLVR